MTLEIEMIVWVDSSTNEGWKTSGTCTPGDIVSVGWVVHETDDAIALSAHVAVSDKGYSSEDWGIDCMCDVMTIPRAVIKKRQVIAHLERI